MTLTDLENQLRERHNIPRPIGKQLYRCYFHHHLAWSNKPLAECPQCGHPTEPILALVPSPIVEAAIQQLNASHPQANASIHGITHWLRVYTNAVMLMVASPGIDYLHCTILAFCVLHDCCRVDDDEDLEHANRAFEFVRLLWSQDPSPLDAVLGEIEQARLEQAILHHTDYKVSPDPTIGICWDADRLDLFRVGVRENVLSQMSTPQGRQLAKERGYT